MKHKTIENKNFLAQTNKRSTYTLKKKIGCLLFTLERRVPIGKFRGKF